MSESGVIVHGTARQAVDVEGLADCHQCDFRNQDDMHRLISSVRPDQVVHLAACSDPAKPQEMLQVNVSGTWQLLEACGRLQQRVQVLLVGSAASFGEMHPAEDRLSGERACQPGSLYGVSRHTQLELGRITNAPGGVEVFLCRTFNLIGPGISERYVPAALAKRIAAAAQNGNTQLAVRDLDAVRDFIDVRDAAAAYMAILEKGRSGYPYSVGCGTPVTVRELAELIAKEQGTDIRLMNECSDSSWSRSGIQRSVADPSDLMKETGWAPRYTLAQSVKDMRAASNE